MHFVIMGCGRVGASLAISLEKRGHSVAVIDQDSNAFRRLPVDFSGQVVTGVGFDRDSLIQAGIEDASGFAATSSGDNSNIIAARVVRDNFGIDNVVARIYDSSRAEVFNRLGVDTVAPVAWTAENMMRELIALGPHVEHTDGRLGMSIIDVDIHDSWFGATVADVERITGGRVCYLGRNSSALIPDQTTVINDGDNLKIACQSKRSLEIQRLLNHPIPEDQR